MARFSDTSGQDRARSKNFGVLQHVMHFLAPYWRRVIVACVALVGTAMATLAIGHGLSRLIDQGIADGTHDALTQSILFLFALGSLIAIGSYMRFYMMTWLGERVVADMRNAVFDKVVTFDQSFFEVTRTGEVLSRLTTDTTVLQTVVGSSMSMALRNAIMVVGGMAMMFVTNAKLAALSLILVPVVVVPVIIIGRRVRVLSKQSQDRVADIGAFAEETLSGIQTVQSFTHEAYERNRFTLEVRNAFDTALRRTRLRSALNAVVTLVVFFGIGTVLWVGGGDVISGEITGGELGAFVFYAMLVALSAGIVSEVYGDLQRAAGATERLVELLETEPDILAPDAPLAFPPLSKKSSGDAGDRERGRVTLENVVFSYPSRPDTRALDDVSIEIEPGETVALVGPSGAGKTTVFQLLLRFFDPKSGALKIEGVTLRDADPVEVRRRLALVPQEPFLFGDTAMSNIRYGDPEASDAAVYAAARAAMADDFIRELPDGYDSFLGERGIRLSGGQRQRISIARALLRDPAVLLLDEATSALDAENEALVQNALNTLMQERTTLVIAHRLSTVINADRIVVMNQGRVEAVGPHGYLMEANPLYRRLADLQFSEPAPRAAE